MIWLELAGLLALVVLVVLWALGMFMVVYEMATAPLVDERFNAIEDPYHRLRGNGA